MRRGDSAIAGARGRPEILILLVLVALAMPARAGEPIPADPWQIIRVAREFGPAKVARDGMNDPQIRGMIEGMAYRVSFYGCRLGRDCDTILFDARFSRKEWAENPLDAKVFAGWNREKLFGRAWGDGQGTAVLDHPVALEHGIAKPALRAIFARWQTALREYAGYLGLR